MSAVSDKKDACGYENKPVNRMCSNCAHFALDRVLTPFMLEINASRPNRPDHYTVERHGVEKNMRCTKHGFTVKKMSVCRDWTGLPEAAR